MRTSSGNHGPFLSHLLNPTPSLKAKARSFFPAASSRTWRRRSLLLSLPLSILLSTPTSAAAPAPSYDPLSDSEKNASAALSGRVSDATQLLDLARDFQAKGDFPQALDYFSLVIRDYKDFAFSEYARVGRALALYEIGDREEAIAEMEDVSISLKGYPEIHAALAAALYADKHAPLLAENQFAIATLLDPHYTDLSYVRETKHWPPSLVSSLQHFITLT
ncbi:uncharacterized protein LOC103720519 [Phoenix dactylifera]|uniref:Uncharacterized protein LOC103720519 n=1 Tax=Phoenix dactylifera TaxID=42345 RepID=A0A8B7MWV7_PHODC|nr:uncharacterized protein LOC103720519 [Phoenix dactylifera]